MATAKDILTLNKSKSILQRIGAMWSSVYSKDAKGKLGLFNHYHGFGSVELVDKILERSYNIINRKDTRIAVMNDFGLDGNGKFKDTDVQKFYEKYKVQLDEIRVVRNDLIAHSFNSETTDTRKIDNHVRCYDILTKYQTPKKNTFTGDLIMLCKNKLEAYEP